MVIGVRVTLNGFAEPAVGVRAFGLFNRSPELRGHRRRRHRQ